MLSGSSRTWQSLPIAEAHSNASDTAMGITASAAEDSCGVRQVVCSGVLMAGVQCTPPFAGATCLQIPADTGTARVEVGAAAQASAGATEGVAA